MAATVGSKIASLVLRVLTFVFLFIAIIILATNSKTVGETKVRFSNVNAYRFMMAAIIIGGAFNLLQIAFALYNIIMKGDVNPLFEFYGDKVLSYLLLAGAAAGLGAGIDLKTNLNELLGHGLYDSFFDNGNAAAALLLLAFLCSAVVSILSSLALTKTA